MSSSIIPQKTITPATGDRAAYIDITEEQRKKVEMLVEKLSKRRATTELKKRNYIISDTEVLKNEMKKKTS